MKTLALFLMGLVCFAAGVGVNFAGSRTGALQTQVSNYKAELAAAHEFLALQQPRLDGVPGQIKEAVVKAVAAVEANHMELRDKDLARIKAGNDDADVTNRKALSEQAAASRSLEMRLADATSEIQKLTQIADSQKTRLAEDRKYAGSLETRLRVAYMAAQNAQGQASMDQLASERAQREASDALRQSRIAQANALQAQAEAQARATTPQTVLPVSNVDIENTSAVISAGTTDSFGRSGHNLKTARGFGR